MCLSGTGLPGCTQSWLSSRIWLRTSACCSCRLGSIYGCESREAEEIRLLIGPEGLGEVALVESVGWHGVALVVGAGERDGRGLAEGLAVQVLRGDALDEAAVFCVRGAYSGCSRCRSPAGSLTPPSESGCGLCSPGCTSGRLSLKLYRT
jgi:hypothetical protein